MDFILKIIYLILKSYSEIIIIQIILSFLCTYEIINASNSLVKVVGRLLYMATEPLLRLIRQIIPPLTGRFGSSIDMSHAILLIAIYFLRYCLNSIILW
ncbi:MAG: YggT family protein [Candidatus Liberibacter europaeus]|uniref:YggT family protein n=1 Tax=Candidatus Liberibacter europaeus TaxID=744859 RepID=A0A2T4VY59_9HYPH|nr:YggT family protein [Candidatus Liberibacter europaeus]PTL86708.1 MAG: YggT family protein [Candidatus Liberibacter europaeus]